MNEWHDLNQGHCRFEDNGLHCTVSKLQERRTYDFKIVCADKNNELKVYKFDEVEIIGMLISLLSL